MRLLLAAVGINLSIARKEEDEDEQIEGDSETNIKWDLHHEDWIGVNLRKAYGVPLQKDADYRPPTPPSPPASASRGLSLADFLDDGL